MSHRTRSSPQRRPIEQQTKTPHLEEQINTVSKSIEESRFCKQKTGTQVSMKKCLEDAMKDKNSFVIIYKDSTSDHNYYGTVLDLEDLQGVLRTYKIAAYINLWKGNGYIPFYFTKWIIHYINRHENDKINERIPNILIVEKKSSWFSLVGWPDYFDIHFADYENGHVTPIKDTKRIKHINYTEDDKERKELPTLYEFVPKKTIMAEPPQTKHKYPTPLTPSHYPYYPPIDDESLRRVGVTTYGFPRGYHEEAVAKDGFGAGIEEAKKKAELKKYNNNRKNWGEKGSEWQELFQKERAGN